MSNDVNMITVYIPTYNRVLLLKRAISSVVNQSYNNFEIIVVDDGSTDGTIEYLSEVTKKNKKISYFQNENNSGACVSRNKAIFSAKGKFVTGLDDDDYFLPDHLRNLFEAWCRKEHDVIAISTPRLVKLSETKFKQDKYSKKNLANNLLVDNFVGNQIFTETSVMREVGGFSKEFPAWQDLEMWYKILVNNPKKYILSIPSYTYVFDISHLHERISTKKTSNISIAYNLFCDKYDLNEIEKSVLYFQCIAYTNKLPSLKVTCLKLRYENSIIRFVEVFKYFCRVLYKKLTVL
jgi:glycosyltransferase involved in cell wall biosynthesis